MLRGEPVEEALQESLSIALLEETKDRADRGASYHQAQAPSWRGVGRSSLGRKQSVVGVFREGARRGAYSLEQATRYTQTRPGSGPRRDTMLLNGK